MTNIATLQNEQPVQGVKQILRDLLSRYWPAVLSYSFLLIAGVLLIRLPFAVDYVGADNDDAMRLVEVRDFLNGQSWFDLHQYRLGFEGGTLMHWSRVIDLPIALLISLFRLVVGEHRAEAVALAIWPLSLVVPALAGMGLAGRRIGGVLAMHVCLMLTTSFVIASHRFFPGSIDHHNAQIALVSIMLAMMLDPASRLRSGAITGASAAVAIAIGAETTPLIATISLVVALRWAWEGNAYRPFAAAYGTALAGCLTILFFGTVPPHLYLTETCDNLSIAFYSLAGLGGIGLSAVTLLAARLQRPKRFALLVLAGAGLALCLKVIAPQCLQNPLAGLDPLVFKFWLNFVGEAQSMIMLAANDPGNLGLFYGTPSLAIAVCLFRIIKRDRIRIHLLLLPLLIVSLAISVIQLRGTMFSHLVAIPVLALFVIDLRGRTLSPQHSIADSFLFVIGALASVAPAWGLVGGLMLDSAEKGQQDAAQVSSCYSQDSFLPLKGEPAGLVAAPVDMGVPLLRFTQNRVLSAPYHRNANGILAQIRIGLAQPSDAELLLRATKSDLVAFCGSDPQVQHIIEASSQGFYAELSAGRTPSFLEQLGGEPDNAVRFYRLRTAQ